MALCSTLDGHVADRANNHQIFQPDGTFVADDQFDRPSDLAIDKTT
jgi:hypothetical protein